MEAHLSRIVPLVFLWSVGAAPLIGGEPAAEKPQAAGRTVVLDANAYWQFLLVGGPARVDPNVLKNEGEKYLSKGYLKRVRSGVVKSLKKRGKDPEAWQQHVSWRSIYASNALLNSVQPTPPPAEWFKPSYAARDWTRARRPFLMEHRLGMTGLERGRFVNIQRACYRSWFNVDDPAKVKDLKFTATYRGGMRLLINGKEVGRGHLPEGDLAPNAPAIPFPAEAYYIKPDERPPGSVPDKSRIGKVASKEFFIAKETLGTFDGLRRHKSNKNPEFKDMGWDYHFSGCKINRKGFDRLIELRNRTSTFKIPASALKKGPNLLAIDLRGCQYHPLVIAWGGKDYSGTANWDHCWIIDVKLTADAPPGLSAYARPKGTQVWAEDVHCRVFDKDYDANPSSVRETKIVAARGGTYSAQVVIGTDTELSGLKATVSPFKGESDATLPADIATVMYGIAHPTWELRALGEGKGGGMSSKPGPAEISPVIIKRYFSLEERKKAGKHGPAKFLKELKFFDHLSTQAPKSIPAGSAQPVWVSVKVPVAAKPRTYNATVTVQAQGLEAVNVNLKLEVLDWRVPEPSDFATIMALEQSPYAVAKQYKVELWSDEHFKLIEASLKQMGRAGGDFLGIPILVNTEFGNRADSPIRMTRTKDGALKLDYTILDRYLDLAVKHLGTPQCICFLASHAGGSREKQAIKIHDEATGKDEVISVDRDIPSEKRRQYWRTIASGLHLHMKARGQERNMYWGLMWDGVSDESLPILLNEFAPGVTWVRYSHRFRPNKVYTWCATVRGGGLNLQWPTRKGWKSSVVNLNISRNYNDVWTCYGSSFPYACRVGPERALAGGGRGIGRMGADYWLSTWLDGHKPPGFMTGMPFLSLLWPGASGAETSVRYEMMLEGLQEAEARVFVEQAVEKLNDEAFTKKATAVLDRHFTGTLLMPDEAPHPLLEEHASGWQDRSRELYVIAAEAARKIGVDFETLSINRVLPALGKPSIALKLRNWTSAPREWKVAGDQPWIQPSVSTGKAGPGTQELKVVLDATKLKPGESATGNLTLTDVARGRTESAKIAVRVSPICTLTAPETVANLDVGGSGKLAYTLLNGSANIFEWKLESSVPWVTLKPAGGKLGVAEQTAIEVGLNPGDKARARHDLTLKLTGSGGYTEEKKLVVHVLPPYSRPAGSPKGTSKPLPEWPKETFKMVKGYKGRPTFPVQFWNPKNPRAGSYRHAPTRRVGLAIGVKTEKDKKGRPVYSPFKKYERGYICRPGHRMTLLVEGRGVTGFSAEVGYQYGCHMGPTNPRIHFEVYVDGAFKAHSHLMKYGEAPRLLSVDGLKDAKEITLVTRIHTDRKSAPGRKTNLYGAWGEPALYMAGE